MKQRSDDIDSILIDKVKHGNKGAYNILVTKYYSRIYASLLSFTKSKEDAEDLAQQTFTKAWQQIVSFRGDSSFYTWIYRIAINLAKNFVASASFKKQKINTSIEDNEIDISNFETLEISIIHKESMSEIREFINTLPESLKTAFTLREINGKSYEEIGEITDTPIGTVRSRIFRARESIVNFIDQELINNE